MDTFTSMANLFRRQQDESGANKLLDLLENPYQSQVSFNP